MLLNKETEMEYKPTEEQLQEWGKPIVDSIYGLTKGDLEPLFEKFVLPFYYAVCTFPEDFNIESKWKMVNRETGEEYSRVEAIISMKKMGYFKSK